MHGHHELKISRQHKLCGGCVGELMTEVHSKLMEQIQKRSKQKQDLHLVKCRPIRSAGAVDLDGTSRSTRQRLGDYYIARSNHSNGRMLDFR